MGKAMKKAKTNLCDRCGAAPANTKLAVAGVTMNGNKLVQGQIRQRLCDGCAVTTMREFTAAIAGVQ
jgi:hypothetical protein